MTNCKNYRYLGIAALSGLLVLTAIATGGRADDATLLPNAIQYFMDANGKPLANGKVFMYTPTTTTPKTTWTTADKATAQPQPFIPLGISGKPANPIYGDGSYRQLVKDQFNNTIWDFITASTGGGGGTPSPTTGDGNTVGTILVWGGLVAPPNYIFAYGQEISRATYPLFTSTVTIATSLICTSGLNVLSGIADTQNIRLGSPVEASCIPPGTTVTAVATTSVTVSANASTSTVATATFFPYGNGNGSSTLNVPDLRGFALIGRNNMGGTASSHMTDTNYRPCPTCTAASPNALGAQGGAGSKVLLATNLPAYTPAGVVTNGAITSTFTGTAGQQALGAGGGSEGFTTGSLGHSVPSGTILNSQAVSTFAGTPQGGTSAAFPIVQPSVTMNYVIKVLPDVSTVVASGVDSIGGMTGVIACGVGLTCGSNTISTVGTSIPAANVTFVQDGTGAVVTSLDTLLRNKTWSPEMFGAVCSPYGTAAASVPDSTSALNAALTAIGNYGGGTLKFGPCVYKTTTGISLTQPGVYIAGSSDFASVVLFQPAAPGSAIFLQLSGGGGDLFNTGIRDLRILSADTTTPKNAINMTDVSNFQLENVSIGHYPTDGTLWRGGGASTGLRINGHEISGIKNLYVQAEFPLVISTSPTFSTISMDSFVFENTYLYSGSTGNPPVTIDTGVCLLNTSFIGTQNWIGGGDKLRWIDTTSTCRSQGLTLSGVKSEQAVSTAGWTIDIQHNTGLLGFQMANSLLGDSNGIKLRKVINPILSNIDMQIPVAIGLTGLDVDSTIGQLQLDNSSWHSSVIASISGLNLCQGAASLAANSSAIPPQAFYSNSTCLQSMQNVALTSSTANRLLLGQGAAPVSSLGAGTTTTVLHGNAGGAPSFGAVANADLTNASTTVNGQTCTLGSTCTVVAAATSVAVGSTTISGGISNGVLTNGGGLLANTAAGTNGQLFLGVTAGQPVWGTMSGDATITNAGVLTLASTISAGGPTGSATVAPIISWDAKGRLTTVSSATITPAVGSITGLGTGVATALAINVGSAGAPVLFNGAGGTPSSIVLTNATGTAASLTVGAATSSQNSQIADDTTTNASMLLTWVTTNTGNLPLKVTSTKLTFNPSTGALSSPALIGTTSVTSPLLIGGSGTTGTQLTFKTTTGVGTTDQFAFTGGNNGASTFGILSTSGLVVGSTTTALGTSLVGAATPFAGASTAAIMAGLRYGGAGAIGAQVALVSSRGAAPGTLSALQAADGLGGFIFGGDNGVTYLQRGATIRGAAVTTWTNVQNDAQLVFAVTPTGSQNPVDAVTIQQSGGMSIGTTTDPLVGGLQVNGQSFFPNAAADTATTDSTACIATTGGKLLKGTGTLGICLGTSGVQFKTAFAPMAAGLDEIVKLPLWNYRYRKGFGDSGERIQYGLTAQDVDGVLPDLVRHNAEGEAVNYDIGALLPISLRAIQQLKTNNDNLAERLARLENRR